MKQVRKLEKKGESLERNRDGYRRFAGIRGSHCEAGFEIVQRKFDSGFQINSRLPPQEGLSLADVGTANFRVVLRKRFEDNLAFRSGYFQDKVSAFENRKFI